ncbi:DUF5977 domain-containing protein [Chryseobacterium lathyri]|jgi:hypothetical protein|uniref:DUF5977 domain-containing protein n=1 Tax=Chryseobacterium lathyri TaxID=395933 RepID=A0A511Y5X6_9FLAO|nr:DUF5977 domain-containing protein [Chryseobacterium lathyri]GEN70603.1 hypothetical protein CLA01_06750 [Chryseobacterium lathyri]
MKKIKKLIVLILILPAITALGQTSSLLIQNAVNSIAVQSPNAAALFRYSETPVSLYTGVPDISIPIYTIKEGDIEVPISISYHAGGIKVNDEASSIGLGWSLNAGGRVSQIMAGGNDFAYRGYYYNSNISVAPMASVSEGCIVNPDLNVTSQTSSFYTTNIGISDNGGKVYYKTDLQPDLFLINLPGKTYKAYLDRAKTVQTDYPKFLIVGQENINFKLIPSSGYVPNQNGNNFNVINEIGTTYFFDGAQEVSTPLTGTYITGASKYLTKIKDLSGKEVKFSYLPISHSDRLSGCKNTRLDNTMYYTIGYTSKGGITTCNKQTIDESYIEKIEFSNGKIEFAWSDREDVNNSKKISSIKIYNTYKLIKQFDFNYDYLIANDNLNTSSIASWLGAPNNKIFTHRLRLLDVTESITNQKHSFEYNSTNLPNKLSFSLDFWGYFNGQNNSDTYIPDPTKYLKGHIFNITSFDNDATGYSYTDGGLTAGGQPQNDIMTINWATNNKHYLADRRASLQSLAGILTSITYPTGGKTEFEYEPNTFSNYPLQSLINNTNPGIENNYSSGGGVRIKSIKTKEKPGAEPIVKNYIYDEFTNNGTKLTSNGILAELPKYYEIENRCFRIFDIGSSWPVEPNTDCGMAWVPGAQKPFKISIYEGIPSQGMSTLSQGTAVGYSKVTEQVTGKGKTENYFYNTFQKSCINLTSKGGLQFLENGNLIKSISYDNNNQLINEKVYNYKSNFNDNLNTYFLEGRILDFSGLYMDGVGGSPANINAGLIHNYTISLYKSLLESTNTKEYFPAGSNNYVETKTLTTYNNKYQPSIQKTSYPDTSFTETKYSYALEKGNQLMLSKNMVGIPLEIITTQTNNGIAKTLSKTETVYPTSLPDSQIGNFVLPKSVKSYDLLNSSSAFTEVTLNKYDLKGNLIQYTAKDGTPVSIIWGYNYTLPIARIEGANYDNIAMYINDIISTSNDDALNPVNEQALITAEDNLRKNANLANYQITTYTYDPLIGVTSITPSSGIREYYKYDMTNRLEKIVDINNKILKEFKYRYATIASTNYPNEEKSETFTRTNCTGNGIGGTYTYIVPAGTYTDVSILAANQKALDDININGQNMANQNGPCFFPVSCSFIFSSVIGNPQFSNNSTTTVNGTVYFKVYFSGYGIWQNWANGVNIGKVGPECVPSVNRTITFNESSFNRKWSIFIDTTGNCTATLISGTVDASSTNPLNFLFEYQK